MTTGVAILGSTGSIGRCTLKVLERQSDRFEVIALTAFGSAGLLREQVERWHPRMAGLVCPAEGDTNSNGRMRWKTGPDCLIEAATHPDVDTVVNAVVGAAGLEATLCALEAGKRVALANKESLITAGELVTKTARRTNGEIIPVDSEHSAVLQCLAGYEHGDIARLILTASGGPFRDWKPERISGATVREALNHPTWNMGRKITVDSATLANKALEVIEAHFLFGLDYGQIDAVVHPQSIIHAFTEFVDGSILAQVGYPSMELPILYALTYPERVPDSGVTRFDPAAFGALTFEPIRRECFPTFNLGVAAGRCGGTAPTVFNAANEVAVHSFLKGGIRFGRIPEVIERTLEAHDVGEAGSLDEIKAADRWARSYAEGLCC